MAEQWVKKYEPSVEGDIVGQEKAVKELKSFIDNFKSQKKRAAMLYGPSGCGKTSVAYVLANQYNLEVVEVNASDVRNKAQINEKLGGALKQMSLFSKGKIILVDEVDGLSGHKDRGGATALAKLIREAAFPVVMTSFNPFISKLRPVKKLSNLIEFDELKYTDVSRRLKSICNKEGVSYEEIALKGLAMRSGGDMRAAINDLQTLSANRKITQAKLDVLTERNQVDNMPNALIKVLKNTDPKVAISAFTNVQEDFDKQFLWLDENIPKEYKDPKALARAYDMLSRADVFRGRIKRWQHWRFLVYVNSNMTAGVSTAKDEKSRDFVKYTETKRLLKIWMANRKYQKRKSIAAVLAEKTHTSSKRVLQDTIPYMQSIFKAGKGDAIAEELELSDDEIGWLAS